MMHGWGMGGFGTGFIIFGALALVLVGTGVYVLIRRLGSSRRSAGHEQLPWGLGGQPGGEGTAAEVFRLAKRYNGVLTVSDVVTELGLDPEDAERLLQRVTDSQRVDMRVDADGVVRYVFRELIE